MAPPRENESSVQLRSTDWARTAGFPLPLRESLDHLEQEAFQVLRFWNRRKHRMIGRLAQRGNQSQCSLRVRRRIDNDLLEQIAVHVVRTTKRRKDPALGEELARAQ